jgi:hypothetical protein
MKPPPSPPRQIDWRWAAVWSGWIAYFAIAERAAIKSSNPQAPLSYFLRHGLGIPHSQWHRHAGQAIAGGAFVWLVQHLTERNQP